MFPRAPRFEEPRAADVPGPNAYDPTEPQANYKRGAMYEKDARFRNAAANATAGSPSTPSQQLLSPSPPRTHSPCVCATKRGGPTANPAMQRLASLEREKGKLETRLAKAEEQAQEAGRKCNTASAERAHFQTELRLMTQRYERLQDQQASAAKRSAKRESVGNGGNTSQQQQQQVDELKRTLEAERVRHAEELAEAKKEYETATKRYETDLEESKAALQKGREQHAEEIDEAQSLLSEARQALEHERAEHNQSLNDLRRDFEAQMPQLDKARKELEDERLQHRKKMNRMSSQLILGEQERREAYEKRMSVSRELTDAQEKQTALEANVADLQKRLDASNGNLEQMAKRCTAAEDDLERLRFKHRSLVTEQAAARDSLQNLDVLHAEVRAELDRSRDDAEDEHERAESLERQCRALLQSAMQFAQAYRNEQERHNATRLQARIAKLKIQTSTSHSRATSISSMAADEKGNEDDIPEVAGSSRPSSKRSSLNIPISTSSSTLLRHLDETVQEAHETQDIIASTSRLLHEHDSLRRELSEERSDWLNERMDELHEQYLKALQTSGSHTDLLRKIDKLRGELATVEEAYEASVLERMRATRSEEELKSELLETQVECAGLTKRIQELETERTSMANVYRREEAWAQERSSLLDELAHAAHYESAYADLHSEAQMLLVRLSTRADIRHDELNRLGATLSAQANPRNNVLYMDRIRRQLDETRLQSHAIEGERDQLRAQVRALQGQLDVQTHFGGGGANRGNAMQSSPLVRQPSQYNSPAHIQQQQTPTELAGLGLGLELSLDGLTEGERERHAAKTAWQQRPRTHRTGRTLREQRSTPRLRQSANAAANGSQDGGASDRAASAREAYALLNHRAAAEQSYSGTASTSSITMITPSMMAASTFGGSTSQADTSSLLLSPASIAGGERLPGKHATFSHDEPASGGGGFLSHFVKNVGAGQRGGYQDTHDKVETHVSTSFAMPLDDGQFGFEDLT